MYLTMNDIIALALHTHTHRHKVHRIRWTVLPLWGLSPENEPAWMQRFTFPTLTWNGTNRGEWPIKYLKPTLKRTKNGHLKILGVDDMRFASLEWLSAMSRCMPDILTSTIHRHQKFLMTFIRCMINRFSTQKWAFGVTEKKKNLFGSWTSGRIINRNFDGYF